MKKLIISISIFFSFNANAGCIESINQYEEYEKVEERMFSIVEKYKAGGKLSYEEMKAAADSSDIGQKAYEGMASYCKTFSDSKRKGFMDNHRMLLSAKNDFIKMIMRKYYQENGNLTGIEKIYDK